MSADATAADAGLFDLSGRIALVTGAARGLGAAMAEALASAGAEVILTDIDGAALDDRCAALCGDGLAAEPLAFDVTDDAAVTSAIAEVERSHGRLDILVNNAGIAVYKDASAHSREDWDRVMAVDLTALHVVASKAAKLLAGSTQGRIINVASILGLTARPGIASYVVAKHGVVGLTRALAAELGPSGITCNALAPGYFLTPMSDLLTSDEDFYRMIAERTPLGRWAAPEELRGPILFLASSASSFVTGHVLVVDGGLTARLF